MGDLTIDALRAEDWPAMRAIYQAAIAAGDATFELAAPQWEGWDRSHLAAPRLVARRGGEVVGWAALSATSSRPVYAGVVESSIYVAQHALRQGIGRQLLEALCAAADAAGIWTIEAGMFPENVGSLALHERCGFRLVGRRERIGCDRGVWRDTLLLERRSSVAGI